MHRFTATGMVPMNTFRSFVVRSLLLVFAVAGARIVAHAQVQQADPADTILGEWLTGEGKAKVQIYKCDTLYCGKIVWLKEPMKNGKEAVDDKNPDPALQNKPVIGLVIVWGFGYDGDEEWTGGKVYDPESGDTYSGKMTLKDSHTLRLRGYILIPLLGRTEVWTR
jgi:uncharacterized protein (DUF2147 family)